ncbi:MAG: GNAT family N-acetyltransferase [Sphingomonadales bacterium]|nr:MAG: GNAT family N-acetyltransferase [Sphingomonadales bacterium]TNF03572.1 MAG: GNAT family N-acetyltransferase [Sphingomonadales bacterium]
MPLSTRPATISDAPVIALLGRLSFAETFGYLFDGHEGDLSDYLDWTFAVPKIRASLAKAENRYWLAVHDELPVGYAKAKFPSGHPAIGEAKAGQLQKLYVLRAFQDRRIGGCLMEGVAAKAEAMGIDPLWLAVLRSNRRAIGFYDRHGWRSVGADRFSIGAQTFDFAIMRIDRNRKPG